MGIDKWKLNDKWEEERLRVKELCVNESPAVERTGCKVIELLKEGRCGRVQ